MRKMTEIRGVVPVLSTPITRDEQIDEAGLRRLVDFLVEKDIAALWVLGTGSEDMNLTYEKRLQVAEIVTEGKRRSKALDHRGCIFCLGGNPAICQGHQRSEV